VRPKLESHLAEQGLIECKLHDVPADTIMQAFRTSCAKKKVATPFEVQAILGTAAAWPFQFHPSEILLCRGHIARTAGLA